MISVHIPESGSHIQITIDANPEFPDGIELGLDLDGARHLMVDLYNGIRKLEGVQGLHELRKTRNDH